MRNSVVACCVLFGLASAKAEERTSKSYAACWTRLAEPHSQCRIASVRSLSIKTGGSTPRAEAKVVIEPWRRHYNEVRPHSSQRPVKQGAGTLRYMGPPRPGPLLNRLLGDKCRSEGGHLKLTVVRSSEQVMTASSRCESA